MIGETGGEVPRGASDLWGKVLSTLHGGDGSAVLGSARAVGLDHGLLQVSVPSTFHRDRLSSRHLAGIDEALAALAPGTRADIVVDPPAPEAAPDQAPEPPPPARAPTAPADSLDPRLSFDAFVVGESNRLAHAAAQVVAENTTRQYNPLFIYGESGNGKTHLLHAIGLHVRSLDPADDVRYVTCERFTSEFISGIRNSGLDGFTRRYRTCSFLLVDDLQFLEGKVQTQEEFFHTFNEVTASGGRVVLSADRHPGDIPTLPDRLRSRCTSGLLADLCAPEFETRMAILSKKAEAHGALVPHDVLAMIAGAVTRNVRELEGALTRVLADANLDRRPVTVDGADRSLERFLGSASRAVTTERIIAEAADVFGVPVDALCGPSRTRTLVTARQATMYVCRSLTDDSLPSLGRSFGGRDHTTVLHAVRKVEKLMTQRNAVRAKVVELTDRLGARASLLPRPDGGRPG